MQEGCVKNDTTKSDTFVRHKLYKSDEFNKVLSVMMELDLSVLMVPSLWRREVSVHIVRMEALPHVQMEVNLSVVEDVLPDKESVVMDLLPFLEDEDRDLAVMMAASQFVLNMWNRGATKYGNVFWDWVTLIFI